MDTWATGRITASRTEVCAATFTCHEPKPTAATKAQPKDSGAQERTLVLIKASILPQCRIAGRRFSKDSLVSHHQTFESHATECQPQGRITVTAIRERAA